MAKIRLKDNITPELSRLGYKPGDIIDVEYCEESITGAVKFKLQFTLDYLLFPEHYELKNF